MAGFVFPHSCFGLYRTGRLDAGYLGDIYQIIPRRQGPFPARIADHA